MFAKFVKWLAAKQIHSAYQKGRIDAITDQINDRQLNEERRMQATVGKRVVCIGNEWQDPVIGHVVFVDHITAAKQPIQVVHDVLTDKEVVCFGKVIECDKQLLEVILKLTPYDRWNLVIGNSFGRVSWDKPKLGKVNTFGYIMRKLDDANYFDSRP